MVLVMVFTSLSSLANRASTTLMKLFISDSSLKNRASVAFFPEYSFSLNPFMSRLESYKALVSNVTVLPYR